MTQISGGGGSNTVGGFCGTDIPQRTRFDEIRSLIRAHKDDTNTNHQLDTVNKVWEKMQPEIVAEYIAPWVPDPDNPPPVARYLVPPPPSPGDDIVAEYIAVAPGDLPAGYDPNDYVNRTGEEIVDVVNNRDHPDATDEAGRPWDDELIMFYLVAPPPPNPDQEARFNQLRKFDLDMNKTFGALLDVAERIVYDDHVSPRELDEFSRLHYSFELCAKLFYDGVKEYRKDYPMHANPEEYGRVTGYDANLRAPSADEPNDPSTSPLSVRMGNMSDDD